MEITPLHYEISADDRKFLDAMIRDRGALKGLTRSAEDAGGKITAALRQIAAVAGASFGVSQIGNFIKSVVKVRGEIQQLEIAFRTMLGSESKAAAMMQDIKDFAQKTPFTLTDVADNAKQLMAMGIASEKVMETLKSLGDVAAGVSVPIARLAINYGQVSSLGKLQTREIRDFAMAGVPIVEELSRMMGKTREEIDALVSSGEIGFPLVEKAFRNMSSEGGRFYNLMEKQNESVTGQASKLKDQIELMMNAIGESSEGAIYGAIGVASKLVEHYEKIGKALVGLIATYGAYRVALALNTLASSGMTAAELAHYAALVVVKKAQTALNLAMKANPYVLLATVVVGLVAAMWALRDSTTEEEKVQKRLNDLLEASKEKKAGLLSTTDELTRKIKDETTTTYELVKAWKEMQAALPEVYAKMTVEEFKHLTAEQIKHMNATAADRREVEEANKKYEETVQILKKLREEREQASDGEYDGFLSILNLQIAKADRELEAARRAAEKVNQAMKEAELQSEPADKRLAHYEKELKQLEAARNKLEDIEMLSTDVVGTWKEFNIETAFNIIKLGAINDKINEVKGNILAINKDIAIKKYGEAYEQAKKEWEDAERALGEIKSSKDKDRYTVEQYEEARKKAESTKTTYEALGGDTNAARAARAAAEKQARETEKINELRLRAEERIAEHERTLAESREKEKLESEQKMLDIEEESFDKRMRQNELNYRKELAEIERQASEKREKAEAYAREVYIKENGKEAGFDFSKFDMVNLPEELRPEGIEEWIKKMKDLAQRMYEVWVKDLLASEKESFNELLIDFGDYEESKKAIAEEWEKKIALLPEESRRLARRARARDLSEHEADFLKKSALWKSYLGDVASMSLREARETGARLRSMVLQMSDPEVKEALLEMLDEVGERAEESASAIERMFGSRKGAGAANMFFGEGDFLSKIKSFSTTFKGVETSSGAMASNFEKSSAAMSEMSGKMGKSGGATGTIAIIDLIMKTINQVINGLREVVNYLYEYESAMNDHVSQRMRDNYEWMQEFGAFNDKVYSGWNNLKEGNAVGAITDNIIAWHRGLTWGARLAAQWQREIEASLNDQVIGETEINRLYRERYEWAKKTGEETLSYISRNGEELRKQSAENQNDQERLWEQLLEKGEYKSEDYIKKRKLWGVDWLKKDQRIETWSSLAGKTWEEIELLASQNLLSEEGMKFYEELKKAKEEGYDLEARMEDFSEEVREAFTGTTYQSVVDSIIDGFKAGRRSAAEFADTFEELMQGAVLSALETSVDGRIREFYELFAALSEDGLVADEIAQLQSLWTDILTDAGEKADQLRNITGIDMGDVSENTLKGAYAKASQESIDLLAGQTGAVRAVIEDIRRMKLEEGLHVREVLTGINANMVALYQLNANGWREVSMIRDIASEICNINVRLETLALDVRTNTGNAAKELNTIVQTGIKLKGSGLGI